MTVRQQSISSLGRAITLAALIVSGCGKPPEATFVVSKRTDELARPLKTAVQDSLTENFGTPQNLVAWLRLPIDYGVLEGTVGSDVEENSTSFTADLAKPKGVGTLPAHLNGTGLVWQTGPLVDAVMDTRKGEQPVDFTVLDYDSEDQLLTTNARMQDPPSKGDKFEIVGHQMQAGRKLYMQHCMHCHGVSGDGAGPTAQYLNPRPRDYRLGVFKFTSTSSQDRVRRDDLHRIIRYGIPGTYMPSFLLMKEDEVLAITEYIRWLSQRGEFEKRIVDGFYNDYSNTAVGDRVKNGETQAEIETTLKSDDFQAEYEEAVESAVGSVVKIWNRAEEPASVVVPKTARVDPNSDKASIERGRKLYLSDKTKCVSCHGPAAHGDGPQTLAFQKRPDGSEYPTVGLYDDWGHPLKPRDLTSGIYRGGRRPLDLYRRIYAGIKGAAMPAFSTALQEEEIWDLVNYVLSVPYDGKAPPAVKAESTTASAAPGQDSH